VAIPARYRIRVHFVPGPARLAPYLEGRRWLERWDEFIELANALDLVESALDALADRARHWTMVSTVSAYRRNDEPGAVSEGRSLSLSG
jgi:hypothetical protein